MDDDLGRSLLPGFTVVGPLPGDPSGARQLARHDASGVEVAVERIVPGEVALQERLDGLCDVASRVGSVTHRNLGGPLLLGRAPDGQWVLLEERPGEYSLARELQEIGLEPMVLPRALSILAQLAAGLDAAHLAGFAHRDLRPERVTFGPTKPDGVVVQLHGLSRLALMEAAGLCAGGDANLVTPTYASPEQLDGGVGQGPADVYSLGVLAFRLCTGRLPFECATPELYRSAHLESTPHRASKRRPGYVVPLPGAVDDLIDSCLAKEPGARPLPTELTTTLKEAALVATRQTRREQRAAGPMGPWRRLRAKAVETARYVQYVQLGDDSLVEALQAFEPHDEKQKQRDQAVEDAEVHWDAVHRSARDQVHRLRCATLELGLERERLVARGEGDTPGVTDLANQLEQLLQSVAAAGTEAAKAMQAATTELTRTRQEADDWSRREANRVSELVTAVRARRDAAGDPSLHQRIDALDALVKETGGGSVTTLIGH